MIFEFYIGGYSGTSFELHYTRGTLEIQKYDYHHEKELKPLKVSVKNDQDWSIALAYLDSRKWKRYYDDMSDDGTQWEVKYLNKNVVLTAAGSNKYPPGFFKLLKLLNVVTRKVGIIVG